MADISSIDDLPQTTVRKLRKIAPNDQLHAAALKLQAGRPDGKSDNANRFYLKNKYACCHGIREPSRGFPYSEYKHGCTAVHIAHSHGMPDRTTDIRSYKRMMDTHPELRASAATAVAVLAAHQARKTLKEIEASL